jgi:hypothetical protein
MLTLADIENQILCADALEILPQIPSGLCASIVTDPVWPGCDVGLPGTGEATELFARAAASFSRIAPRLIVIVNLTTDPRFFSGVPSEWPFVQLCWLEFIPGRYRGPIFNSADVAYVYGHRQLPGDGTKVFGSRNISVWRKTKPYEAAADPDCPHPCPRSITHTAWLVSRFSRPGDLILDPFCGSGTTCLAAKLAGRRYCGIEIEPKFVEYARDRLSRRDLFS